MCKDMTDYVSTLQSVIIVLQGAGDIMGLSDVTARSVMTPDISVQEEARSIGFFAI